MDKHIKRVIDSFYSTNLDKTVKELIDKAIRSAFEYGYQEGYKAGLKDRTGIFIA